MFSFRSISVQVHAAFRTAFLHIGQLDELPFPISAFCCHTWMEPDVSIVASLSRTHVP